MKRGVSFDFSGRLQQFHHENQAWERSLDFLKQENAALKNRLSQVVDGIEESETLTRAEHFHNRFILTDEFLQELYLNISEQRKILMNKNQKMDEVLWVSFTIQQDRFREQLDRLELDFKALRNDFHLFLAVIL